MKIISKKTGTFYLFSEPSFIEGFARIIDMGGNLDTYQYSKTDEESDCLAIKNDWIQVGEDLESAIHNYESRRLQFPALTTN